MTWLLLWTLQGPLLEDMYRNATRVSGQEWTLRCLNCIAVATGLLDVIDAPHRCRVEASWQALRSILLRSDPRYFFLTKSTNDNAQDDTTTRLLVELVHFQCAGDTKTFDVHDAIWKLPTFTSFPKSNIYRVPVPCVPRTI